MIRLNDIVVKFGDFTALLTGASSERPAHRSCSNA